MRRLFAFLVAIFLLGGCSAAPGLGQHWKSRITHLCMSGMSDAAWFELEEYSDSYPHASGALASLLGYEPNGASCESPAHGFWRFGLAAEMENDFDAALENYEKAVETGSGESLYVSCLAALLLKCGSYRRALELYDGLISDYFSRRLPYRYVSGRMALGMLLLGREVEVIKYLSPYASGETHDEYFWLALGVACFKEKKYAEAVSVFQKAERLGVLSSEAREVYRLALYRRLKAMKGEGEREKGLSLAREGGKLFPDEAVFDVAEAAFLKRLDRDKEAEDALARALKKDPYDTDVVRAARVLLFKSGKYRDGFEAWKKAAAREYVFSRENEFFEKIARVEDSIAHIEKDGPDSKRLLALARAAAAFGWLREAEEVYGKIEGEGETAKTASAELKRIKGHRALIKEMEGYFDALYEKVLDGERTGEIASVVLDISAMVKKHTGVNLPAAPCYTATFFGSELNPLSTPDHPLVKYFLEYNQFLALQEVWGQYPDCKLMNVVYRSRASRRVLGREMDYRVYFCDECVIKSISGYISGRSRIAGTASFASAGFFLDLTGMRPSAREMDAFLGKGPETALWTVYARERYAEKRRLQGRVFASRKLRNGLLEAARKRLGVDEGTERDVVFERLFAAQVENVAIHECGHIRDFLDVVPFMPNMLGNFWMAVENGFSSFNMGIRFESVAETFALANTEYPYLCLLSNLGWIETFHEKPYHHTLLYYPLEDLDLSPYHWVARNLFERFVGEVKRRPGRFSAVKTDEELDGLSKLTPLEVRTIARDYLSEQGLP